jgi:arylsulfatase
MPHTGTPRGPGADGAGPDRPNILIMCIDQWQKQMALPPGLQFPTMARLEAQGVSFDRYYCTVPLCTPSRGTMWTGVHATKTGLWDNTNYAWIHELSTVIPTIGHMLRDQGYYTALKGKWHCSALPRREDALERYGFSDVQQWGEMYGAPLQGEQLDGTAVFEAVDWLETKGARLEQPWLLVCNLINPHDVMFLQTDPLETPHPNSPLLGMQSRVQQLGWFEQGWDVGLPPNFDDDLALQPDGVRYYKEATELFFGKIPDDRPDLWRVRRNYLINSMRLVDREFGRVLDALDRLDLWKNTVVIFTGDHGEMNGAHRMAQKGAIAFDEAAVVNFTACVPGGPQGQRTSAVGSHLDLAPTLLAFAGLSDAAIAERYLQLKGRSLKSAILSPDRGGPRGSAEHPGEGALLCWDALNSFDTEWALSGALQALTQLAASGPQGSAEERAEVMRAVGATYGAPDFRRRAFFRAVVDGRYKLVRWFSPEDYAFPATLDELHATGDVGLYDLAEDPGERENIGHPAHPRYDPALVERMRAKLNALIRRELGDDRAPFDLDLFGTREVKYQSQAPRHGR